MRKESIAFGHNPLTPAEAGALAFGLTNHLPEPDEVARILLLCYAFTYEADMTEREQMLIAVEKALAVYLGGFSELCRAEMRQQLELLRRQRAA